jgi:hypothetical protein
MVAEEQNAVSTALAAARALGGKAQADARLDGLAAGLAELDMDNYDNEDESKFTSVFLIVYRCFSSFH